MKLKRMLKFTLCALLLGVGTSAFAQVQLNNADKTVITWTQFANALKDPSTVTGTYDPTKDQGILDAQGKLETANEELSAAQAAVKEGSKLMQDLSTARQELTEKTNAVAEPKKAYDDAEALLASWNSQIQEKQNLINNTYNSNITSASGEMTRLSIAITNKEKEIDKVPYTNKTITTREEWLLQLNYKADQFQKDFNDDVANDTCKIYYLLEEKVSTFTKKTTLNLTVAFQTESLSQKPANTWEGPVDAKTFRDDVLMPYATGEKIANQEITTITTFNFYVGAEYAAANAGKYTVGIGSSVSFDVLFNDITNYVSQTLWKDENFQTKVENKVYSDANQATLDTLNAELETLQEQYSAAESTYNTNKTNKETAEGEIKELQGNITAYTVTETEVDGVKSTQQARLKAAYEAAVEAQTEAKETFDKAQEAVDKANEAVETAQGNVTTAEQAVTDAENAAQKAANEAAFTAYQKVTLTGNVTVTEPIMVTYNGQINGKNNGVNYVVTLNGANEIFDAFTGILQNVALNLNGGVFAGTFGGAKFYDVVSWNGTRAVWYDEFANSTTYGSLGALGFAARDYFGVDFTSKQMTLLSHDTKVYNITLYNSATGTQYYVNFDRDKKCFVSDESRDITINANAFVASATTTEQDPELANVPNLIYQESNVWKCKNVSITDRVNFFAPFDIQATNVTYDRQFNEGYNTVILPFDIQSNFSSNITSLCTYDTEEEDKFWFTKQNEKIEANTPILLVADAPCTLNIPSGTTIKKTDKQIVELAGQYKNQNKAKDVSYGTFKSASISEFAGEYSKYRVYGYNSGKNAFVYAGDNATFPAFRMVITSNTATRGNQAPRRIGIRDEKGIVITDPSSAIEDVKSEATSFSVVAGQGEITITSDADYGKVPVYSIDGRVAAYADVMVGTTTVNVQRGIYIVMGKKVAVK